LANGERAGDFRVVVAILLDYSGRRIAFAPRRPVRQIHGTAWPSVLSIGTDGAVATGGFSRVGDEVADLPIMGWKDIAPREVATSRAERARPRSRASRSAPVHPASTFRLG
jgi:hypothetical protein